MDIMQFFEKRRKEVAATFASNPYMIIHVDLDCTLTLETCWTPEDCLNAEPNPQMIRAINALATNNVVIIYTARQDHLLEASVKWLRKVGVRFDAISNNKQASCCYIDDRSFNPFLEGHSVIKTDHKAWQTPSEEEPYP